MSPPTNKKLKVTNETPAKGGQFNPNAVSPHWMAPGYPMYQPGSVPGWNMGHQVTQSQGATKETIWDMFEATPFGLYCTKCESKVGTSQFRRHMADKHRNEFEKGALDAFEAGMEKEVPFKIDEDPQAHISKDIHDVFHCECGRVFRSSAELTRHWKDMTGRCYAKVNTDVAKGEAKRTKDGYLTTIPMLEEKIREMKHPVLKDWVGESMAGWEDFIKPILKEGDDAQLFVEMIAPLGIKPPTETSGGSLQVLSERCYKTEANSDGLQQLKAAGRKWIETLRTEVRVTPSDY